jgi:DNA-binding transcriptional LysR family regulator
MFDWNDLRYFCAVTRHGSTLAAGRALGVDQSTVQRRIAALERDIGRVLLKREATGYKLTEFGAAMVAHAQRVEAAAEDFERQAAAVVHGTSGVVRVTCPEPIVLRLQASGLIERFRARHPALQVEFVMSDRYLDLTRGDADIALRSGDTDDGELIGRRIGESYWAVYASRAYLDAHGAPADVAALAGHALIGFDDSMANHRASAWLRRVAPQGRIVARNNSVLGLLQSAKAGLGLAALPTPIADAEPDLVRVLGPVDELTRIWRVLAAPEFRRWPHVAAFFDFVVHEVDALRPIITG